MKQRFAGLAILSLFGMAATASASVIGHLNLVQCPTNGNVTVTLTTIDFQPLGGGTGCIQATNGTTVTFAGGGSIAPGEFGTINDLGFGNPNQNIGFMVFTPPPGSGSLSFDLTSLGPGVANPCTAGMTNGQSCSIPGSPIILTENNGDTGVQLSAAGTVSDGTTPISSWSGLFTTQFNGLDPIDIQNFILGIPDSKVNHGCVSGSCTSAYSGSFDVAFTAVPEPGSMVLIGGGLLGLAATLRKRKKQ